MSTPSVGTVRARRRPLVASSRPHPRTGQLIPEKGAADLARLSDTENLPLTLLLRNQLQNQDLNVYPMRNSFLHIVIIKST